MANGVFRLLGGPMLSTSKGDFAFGGPTAQALVCRLALAGTNGWVTTSALIESMWPDAPAVAASALHPHVSRVRRVLANATHDDGSIAIEYANNSYRLVGDVDVDVVVMTHALLSARELIDARSWSEALAVVDGALDNWRTPVLGVLSDSVAFAGDVARIEHLYGQLALAAATIATQLGRHGRAIDVLEPLLDADPYREDLAASLMVALYRAGRQHDALEAGRRTALALRTDLGVEPGAKLRETELAVLQQDPRLDAGSERVEPSRRTPVARPAWDSLPPIAGFASTDASEVFVGRSDALAAIADAIASGRHLCISGPAGIGKSTLLRNVPTSVRATATDLADAPPWWPWTDLVAQIGDHVGPVAADVGSKCTHVLDLIAIDAGLFATSMAVRELLEMCSRHIDAIVLDDAQLLDEHGAQLLRFLVRSQPGSIPALITGWRAEPGSPPIDVGHVMMLEPLDDAAVAALLSRQLGSMVSRDVVAKVMDRTAGLPIHVDQAARVIKSGMSLATMSAAQGDASWVDALDASTRVTLQVAALMGGEVEVPLVARLSERDLAAAGAAIDAGLSMGLVQRTGSTTVGFRHEIWRRALIESLPVADAVRLHRRILGEDPTLERYPIRRARHLVGATGASGAEPVEGLSAVDRGAIWTAAGEAAAELGHYHQAAAWFERALFEWELGQRELDDVVERSTAHARLAAALWSAGDVAGCRDQYAKALALVGPSHDLAADLAAEAAGFGLVFVDVTGREVDQLHDAVRAARPSDPPAVAAARLRCRSRLLIAEWDPETIEPAARALAAAAAELGDAKTLRWCRGAQLISLMHASGTIERDSVAAAMIDSAIADGDDAALALGLVHRVDCAAELGRFDEVPVVLDQIEALARATGHRAHEWYRLHYRAGFDIARGDVAGGEARLSEALAVAPGTHGPSAFEAYMGGIIVARFGEDRLAELLSIVDVDVDVSATRSALDVWSMTRAGAYAAAGRIDDAAALVAGVVTAAGPPPWARVRLAELAQLAHLAFVLNDAALGALVAGELEPYRQRCCMAPSMLLVGSAEMYLGMAWAAAGELDAAADALDAAVTQNRRWGLGLWEQRSLEALSAVSPGRQVSGGRGTG